MKKGQVTMFVIMGIVLLLGAGLLFYITTDITEDKPVVDVPDVSLETRPANQLITSCLASTAELAIREVAAQGGTLNPPSPNIFSSQGKSVIFEPYEVPFYRYMDEDICNSPFGCPVHFIPPLCKQESSNRCQGYLSGDESIEGYIEQYVLENIGRCIDDLSSLSDVYELEISDDRELEITFTDDSTIFVLTNRLIATSTSTENTQSLEEYRVDLDVSMIEMYDIVTKTLNFISDSNVYETQTMNLIGIYSCANPECLPPTDQLSLFPGSDAFWVQQNVKQLLEFDVLPLMSFMSFANFDNSELLEPSEDFGVYNAYVQGLYSSFSKKINDEQFNGYTLDHYYLYSPITFQINDGSELIEPQEIENPETIGFDISSLLPLQIKDLRFKYFLTYPLVLSISDTEAFGGEGYSYNLGVEVNIFGNKPGYNGVTVLNTGNQQNIVRLDSFPNMVDRDITIQTRNAYTAQSLDEVSISYRCLDEYDIGVTGLNIQGIAELETRLPNCEFGGFLKASKVGYGSAVIPFNNPEGAASTQVTLELWPLAEKEIIVYKRTPEDILNIFGAGQNGLFAIDDEFSELNDKESLLLNIEKIKDSPFEDDIPLVNFAMIDGGFDYAALFETVSRSQQQKIIDDARNSGSLSDQEAQELENIIEDIEVSEADLERLRKINEEVITKGFVPGEYELELTLLEYGYFDQSTQELVPALHIPESSIDGNRGFLGIGRTDDVILPELNITTWLLGGGTVRVDLDEQLLYESDEPLIFYAVEMPKPTSWSCDYLAATNPQASSCNTLGICGEYVPEDPLRYCVSFEDVEDIDTYVDINQLRFLIAPDVLS